ncbi:MAG: hypothetical protein H7232_17055 [Aeromicrobium sp.]|nr:hypothetical protein [Burkholderiales bacterium]
MKKQIVRVSVLQSAKVAAIIYLIVSLPLAVLMLIPSMLFGTSLTGVSVGMLIVMPIVYGLCGFIFTALGAWTYNFAASMVGGFEFTTSEVSVG